MHASDVCCTRLVGCIARAAPQPHLHFVWSQALHHVPQGCIQVLLAHRPRAWRLRMQQHDCRLGTLRSSIRPRPCWFATSLCFCVATAL